MLDEKAPRTMMHDIHHKLFLRSDRHNCAVLHPNGSAGMREQRRALCVFTARERFDLLQDAMSVACGPEMCVSCRVHIVYPNECVPRPVSQARHPACVRVAASQGVFFMWRCVHTCPVCVMKVLWAGVRTEPR